MGVAFSKCGFEDEASPHFEDVPHPWASLTVKHEAKVIMITNLQTHMSHISQGI